MNGEFIKPAWHEVDVNLVFDDRGECCSHGLEPFYAAEKIVRENGGSKRARCGVGDHSVSVKLYYQNSGIGSLNHSSSELDTIREFRISWEVVDEDDDVGERSGNIHIAPRTPNMTDRNGNTISTPKDLTGVNCRVLGSNFPLEEYGELLHRATTALGFDSRYFAEERIHQEYSNIQDAARYVRLIRDHSGPIHAVDGVLARISNLLANDREGYRKHVADDTETPGYYHTATIGPMRAGELIDQHHFPKEFKHYLAREAESLDRSNPLYHPKVEAALQTSRANETVRWEDRTRIGRELDEALLNILQWEGFPVTEEDLEDDDRDGGEPPGGRGPYVEDQYFEAETTRRQRRLLDDPTPEIKDEQEHVFIRHVVDGFEDSDLDVLDVLVSDGGEIAPKDVADRTGWQLDTVYRAIDRLEDLVEHNYAELQLRSHYLAQRITEAVQYAREDLEDALTTVGKAFERSVGLEVASDALLEWIDGLGVEVEDRRDAQVALRFGRVKQTRNAFAVTLTNGLHEWMRAGWDRDRFLKAEVDVHLKDGHYRTQAEHLLKAPSR